MRPLSILIPVALVALAACGERATEPSEVEAALSDATVETTPAPQVTMPASEELPASLPEGTVLPAAAILAGAQPEESPSADDETPARPLASFSLRRGETLAHFARWSGLDVEDVAATSELDLDGRYPVGTEVRLDLSDEQLAQVHDRREAHRTARVQGYLDSRGGSGRTETIAVRTGDSAWTIARHDHGIPVWLLEAYNPEVDLDRLRPGQSLLVPVIADTVADAGREEVDLLADDRDTVEVQAEPEGAVEIPEVDLLADE